MYPGHCIQQCSDCSLSRVSCLISSIPQKRFPLTPAQCFVAGATGDSDSWRAHRPLNRKAKSKKARLETLLMPEPPVIVMGPSPVHQCGISRYSNPRRPRPNCRAAAASRVDVALVSENCPDTTRRLHCQPRPATIWRRNSQN